MIGVRTGDATIGETSRLFGMGCAQCANRCYIAATVVVTSLALWRRGSTDVSHIPWRRNSGIRAAAHGASFLVDWARDSELRGLVSEVCLRTGVLRSGSARQSSQEVRPGAKAQLCLRELSKGAALETLSCRGDAAQGVDAWSYDPYPPLTPSPLR